MYIDGFVIPVPTGAKQTFLEHARMIDPIFLELGALRVIEGWGDDVPAGQVTDFARSVALAQGETVAFSWIEWPDKATRDAAFEKLRNDPRTNGLPPPFDGKRMIFGGFDAVVVLEK